MKEVLQVMWGGQQVCNLREAGLGKWLRGTHEKEPGPRWASPCWRHPRRPRAAQCGAQASGLYKLRLGIWMLS